MGLYDVEQLRPPLEWRVGRDGESYEGIGRDRLNLAGFPLLVDASGPFGSPISDSMRTRVTESSTRILWITFAPPQTAVDLNDLSETMRSFNGGEVVTSTQYDV
jgi:DNA/RNA-binding domain of Phe-tRNA-synthetase-like protein